MRALLLFAVLFTLLATSVAELDAQNRRRSPRGACATDIGGKWVEVEYGRPILRGRRGIFGEGEEYGEKVGAGAPVWRLGADKSTRLVTEHTLAIGGKTVAPGEYSLFVNLGGPADWELVVSTWGAQETFSRDDKENLWGSYGYTPDKDVVRADMIVSDIDMAVDQLTIGFINVTDEGGQLAVWWDDTMATVDFTVVK